MIAQKYCTCLTGCLASSLGLRIKSPLLLTAQAPPRAGCEGRGPRHLTRSRHPPSITIHDFPHHAELCHYQTRTNVSVLLPTKSLPNDGSKQTIILIPLVALRTAFGVREGSSQVGLRADDAVVEGRAGGEVAAGGAG